MWKTVANGCDPGGTCHDERMAVLEITHPHEGITQITLNRPDKLNAMTSELVTIFKNTALTLTIGVAEITSVARKIEAWSFKGIEAYTVASLTYIATTIVVILLMNWLEKRAYIPGLIKRGGETGGA